MTHTTSLSRHLEIALREQICEDRMIGTPELDECSPDLQGWNKVENAMSGCYLTTQEEERLIAIVSLINELLSEAEGIAVHAMRDTTRLP